MLWGEESSGAPRGGVSRVETPSVETEPLLARFSTSSKFRQNNAKIL